MAGSCYGVKRPGGRPNRLGKDGCEELIKQYYTRPYSYRQIARIMGVPVTTVWRAVRRYECARAGWQ